MWLAVWLVACFVLVFTPLNVTAVVALPVALLSRVHHNVCALFGLMRDLLSWHH